MVNKLLKKVAAVGRILTTKRMAQLSAFIVLGATVVSAILLVDKNIAVLNPQGIIASKERDLMIFTTLLGLVVIIPVFIMLFSFAWKYREGNPKKTKYTPDVGGSRVIETLWWGIPTLIITILGVVTWISTHDLDPYKKLSSDQKPITIQVVALQWKWLFLYPEQGVATVNEVRFPEKTPVDFKITADAPMSAFWIPNLGSQTYAMNGMTSQLSLMADRTGEYHGSNTNINGEGYAKMRFKAISTPRDEFDRWSRAVATSDNHFTWDEYEQLAQPNRDNDQPVAYYMLHQPDIFDQVLAKYMGHGAHSPESATMEMNHEGNGH